MDLVKPELPGLPAPIENNRDFKIWGRRWKVWQIYTTGTESQSAIAEALGIDRGTVDDDLRAVRELMKFTPETIEQIIRETYTRMVMSRNTVAARAQDSENDFAAAKLWEVVADFDKKILERFTQQTGHGKTDVHIDQTGKLAIDYITETYGPDGLQHFINWCERRNLRAIPVERSEKKGGKGKEKPS